MKFVKKSLDFELIETVHKNKGFKIIKYFYLHIPTYLKKTNQFSPDVIIQACAGLNTGIMSFIAKNLNVPFLYRVANDIDTDYRINVHLTKYQLLAYKFGLQNSSAIICQNNYQYNQLLKKYPNKILDILFNPFYLNKNILSEQFKKRNYIAWIGVFQKQKNLPLLFDIAKSISSVKFKIAGIASKTVDAETNQALSNLMKLKNVEFVGYLSRKEVIRFLSKSIALLNTSHYEGFSNTFLEAFSVGTPVIVNRHSDPNHIIKEHSLGYSVEKKEEFIELIKSMLHDEDRFKQMSEDCMEYVQVKHDPQVLASRLIDIVKEL